MRSLVQQDMMRPKSATHYTGEMEEIAGELVTNIEAGVDRDGCLAVQVTDRLFLGVVFCNIDIERC